MHSVQQTMKPLADAEALTPLSTKADVAKRLGT